MTNQVLEAGQQVYAAANVNMRQTPGYREKPADDILGTIPQSTEVVILAGAESVDDLRWWRVSSTLPPETPVEGWVAEQAPDGTVLLSASRPLPARNGGPSTFFKGESVTNIARFSVNLRRSVGYIDKVDGDILGRLGPGLCLDILQGPDQADQLQWWKLGDGNGVEGWVAECSPNGQRFLAPAAITDTLVVDMPFPTPYRVTQWWGKNRDFYRKFTYDGIPLRGHNGIDFGIPVGVSLLAVAEGTVRSTGFEKAGFGHYVLLNHTWGESLYAHLSEVQVEADQPLERGEQLGLSGNTGASTGPHLHFGIRIHPYRRTDGWGGFTDPEPLLMPQTFMIATATAPGTEMDMAPTPMSSEDPDRPRP